KRQLDAIGFVWEPYEVAWEQGLSALTTFNAREGHCRVPTKHIEGEVKLGAWVREQRDNDRISVERKQRLDALGFIWNALESTWEQGFSALTTFKEREGHCRVPATHTEASFKLGQWVSVQRVSQPNMSPQRKQRLDAIGFIWNTLES